ncbi:Cytidylate kinase (fragment) [Capnocytophaga canimorsus]|uniref:(d)CMP kinase n=1 Tax=Capnocytophaga canimorsus TaxID=28188 RepID=A0A0B7HNU4_9FLAO
MERILEKEIRSITIANHVSKVAKIPEVRSYLVELQRKMAEKKGVVMDGRDIGTVVFPDAELKIFMTASESIRAQRRYDELLAKGEQVQLHQVLKNIQERDEMDTNRTESPLRKAQDAIELDNSQTTIAQMVKTIVDLARKQIQL